LLFAVVGRDAVICIGHSTGAVLTRLIIQVCHFRQVSGPGHESLTPLVCGAFFFYNGRVKTVASPAPDLPLGDSALIAVDRALSELRRGRAIVLGTGDPFRWRLAIPLETASEALIAHLISAGNATVAVTGERATALEVERAVGEVIELTLPAGLTAKSIRALGQHWEADAWRDAFRGMATQARGADSIAAAALSLAKSAQLLPALLLSDLRSGDIPGGPLRVRLDEVTRYAHPQDDDLLRVSEANVPLREGAARLVLFRDRDAREQVAVIVGTLDTSKPVPVRVHSSCFTGDLLGSLRCDCGEQLQAAVARLQAAGGGVLLYLAQEGRGIGLANKLRAYQLQDAGLDTLDADRHLGFSADERSYAIAAAMLRQLQIKHIKLLTNSPHKVRELRERGIDIVEIEPLTIAPNTHNEKYLRTKRDKAGHFSGS
jgi:GTP cyclohydrolase II